MDNNRILIVDDQPEILNALERLLKDDYTVYKATSGLAGLDILKKHTVAVILADQRMPQMSGVDFFSRTIDIHPDAVRILITAYADINASIEAINKGQIYHYISKPWEPEELQVIVSRAVEKYELIQKNRDLTRRLQEANELLERENIHLRQSIPHEYDFTNIIGHSPPMIQVFKLMSKVIETPTTVLLLGDTGTGKELIARAIHFNSPRRDNMFVAQNCGALPDSLLESELFGHVKGSFTGAVADRKGLFEVAKGGTVFLDEIADTSPALQLRLLRVLQEGEIKPVGSTRTIRVDVRIIAATNKILMEQVKNGTFREDLYYRLNVFPITLPPLRERKEDLPDLINHFLNKYSTKIGKTIPGITDQALEMLRASDFPGNIRELENEIERAITLADNGSPITPELLSPRFHHDGGSTEHPGESLKAAVEALEKKLIRKALQSTRGNILQAAGKLKISRAGLHKKLNRYHIDPNQL